MRWRTAAKALFIYFEILPTLTWVFSCFHAYSFFCVYIIKIIIWIIIVLVNIWFVYLRTSSGSTLTNMRASLPPYVRTLIHWMNQKQGRYCVLQQVQILIGKKYTCMIKMKIVFIFFFYLDMFHSYFFLHDLHFTWPTPLMARCTRYNIMW